MSAPVSNGLSLTRSAWDVLVRDKQLVVFPLVSGTMFLLVVASFAVPLAVLVDWDVFQQQLARNGNRPPLWTYPVTFGFYLVTYFVMAFCNAALVSCALLRFHGHTPTVRDGFRAALARLPQIFAWAVVSATVGLLLNLVERVHEKAGRWVAALLGTAWSVVTYFVVPVLVVEKVGPFTAVSRSTALLKKTWGESLVGRFGLGMFLVFLLLPVLFLFVLAAVSFVVLGSAPLGVVFLAAGVVGVVIYAAVSSALGTILLAALYEYAVTDAVPAGFDRGLVAAAFATAPAKE